MFPVVSWIRVLKFIYSEKATKFCEIFPLLLTAVHTVKSLFSLNVPKIFKVFRKKKNSITLRFSMLQKRELLTNFRSTYHTEECLVVELEKKL